MISNMYLQSIIIFILFLKVSIKYYPKKNLKNEMLIKANIPLSKTHHPLHK